MAKISDSEAGEGKRMKAILGSVGIVVIFFGLALAIMMSNGCAMIKIKTDDWSVSGMSFCRTIDIPKITKGDLVIEGYHGEMDSESLGRLIGTAVKASK